MKSPLAVNRPHTSVNNVNRRKNLGKSQKSLRNQMKQWISSSVLIREESKYDCESVVVEKKIKQVSKAKEIKPAATPVQSKKAEPILTKKDSKKEKKQEKTSGKVKNNSNNDTLKSQNGSEQLPNDTTTNATKPSKQTPVIEEEITVKKQNVNQAEQNKTSNKKEKTSSKKNTPKCEKSNKEENSSATKESAPKETEVSPPVQVYEVTSSISDKENQSDSENNVNEIETKANKSDKKLLENVQKLATQVAAKIDNQLDPLVKLHIDAQLLQLSQKIQFSERERSATPVLNVVTPLPIQNISRPVTPTMRERLHKLLPQDILFCSRLMDKHGDNYEAMVKDPNNTYRENARSLQRKIRIFKESPHYQVYLDSKRNSVPLEELLAQQTA